MLKYIIGYTLAAITNSFMSYENFPGPRWMDVI